MKKLICIFAVIGPLSIQSALSQTNTFPSSGSVGIGTTSPSNKLHIDTAYGDGLQVGNGAVNMKVLSYGGGALTDVPGSTFGVQLEGPVNSHVVLDIQGNDGNDGFYVRVPTTLETNPTVDKTAFVVKASGNVGIGTNTPGNKLEVNGTIRSKEVIVETTGWPDYVFKDGYNLLTLDEVETHIAEKGHLPGIPSAKEVTEKGVSLGDSQRMLLEKVEELTLYMIQLKKDNESLRTEKDSQISQLRSELKQLKSQLN